MHKGKFKVAIVIKNIDGGTGTFMFQLLKLPAFSALFTCAALSLEEPRFIQVHKYKNIVCFPHKNKPYGYRNLPKVMTLLFKEFFFLRRHIATIGPDVVIPIDLHCSLMVSLLKILYFPNLKILVTIHNNISAVFCRKHTLFPPWLIRLIGKIVLRYTNASVGVSRGVAQEFQKIFSLTEPIKVIYYGLDREETTNMSHEKIPHRELSLFKPDRTTIVSVGRLAPQKDIETLLRACKIVSDVGSPFRLILLGDGKDRKRIYLLIEQCNLQDHVSILGWKKNIYPYLARSDIFVLSSFYEGFPYVILEAMSQGLPIISTDAPFGPREVLGSGRYGKLVPIGNAQSLAATLLKFIRNKKLRQDYARKSSLRIHAFTQDIMLAKYADLIIKTCR